MGLDGTSDAKIFCLYFHNVASHNGRCNMIRLLSYQNYIYLLISIYKPISIISFSLRLLRPVYCRMVVISHLTNQGIPDQFQHDICDE